MIFMIMLCESLRQWSHGLMAAQKQYHPMDVRRPRGLTRRSACTQCMYVIHNSRSALYWCTLKGCSWSDAHGHVCMHACAYASALAGPPGCSVLYMHSDVFVSSCPNTTGETTQLFRQEVLGHRARSNRTNMVLRV